MLYQALRRLGAQAPKFGQLQQQQQSGLRRGLAGGEYAKPKVDTSLDHVFGDNSQKLDYNVGGSGLAAFEAWGLFPPRTLCMHS